MADFYIPPKFTKSPILSWPRLIIRRILLFALNTYSIIAYKRELEYHYNLIYGKIKELNHILELINHLQMLVMKVKLK